jgi:hypothetical protein
MTIQDRATVAKTLQKRKSKRIKPGKKEERASLPPLLETPFVLSLAATLYFV